MRRVGLIGAGVIGCGWAVRCLARGYDVAVWDPSEEATARLEAEVAERLPRARRISLAPQENMGRLTIAGTMEAAVEGAGFVQESAPEREQLKQDLLSRIDRVAPPEVVIASSSSGLLPTRLQAQCRHPGRVVIGHPFNPVYLLPLVEIVAGRHTDRNTVDTAAAFYSRIGMRPLEVRREIEGYISDRLQEAVWREALHLVADGVATTEEIDDAIIYGPGLRWAFMGPCLTFHLAGGGAGMAHMLEQFGPALELPWTKLQAPKLTEELARRMIEGTHAQADGRGMGELERERDEALIAILQTLRARDIGAGRVVAEEEAGSYAARSYRRWRSGEEVPAPLALYRAAVPPEWIDYNGHMSESFYLQAFGDASDALFRYIGIDESYRNADLSFFTVESHINFYREAGLGTPLAFTTQVLDVDAKRLHFFHSMTHAEDGTLLATTEQMLLHVNMATGRTTPIRSDVAAALEAVADAHRSLPVPDQVGRRMAIPRKDVATG